MEKNYVNIDFTEEIMDDESGYIYIETFEDVGMKTGYYKLFKIGNQVYEKLKSECYELINHYNN